MPYFRIIIIKRNGLKHAGIRHFHEAISLKNIRAEVREKTVAALGPLAIADILIEEVPADHPEVVAFILQQKDRPPVTKKTYPFRHRK
ncbi:MAG TPA: hypothetical protein VHC48_19565 [Puia sp.]|nr:hypothetical protein [Puia sp.]